MIHTSPSNYLALIEAKDAQLKAEANGVPYNEAFHVSVDWFLSECKLMIEKRYIDFTGDRQ